MQVSTLLGQKWEVLSPTPYPQPLLTPTPSKNSLARTCLTSEWYNKAVDKFLFWNMIGKHNFQCVWMAEDQSCPERAKPQRIGCSVLCSTLNMKFQAIAIKRCLRSKKKNIYYIRENNSRTKTRWNRAETAKTTQNTSYIKTKRKVRNSDVCLLLFLTAK